MAQAFEHSTRIQSLLDRLRAGDVSARDELLAHVDARLRSLTRRIFGAFRDLRSIEETDDIAQQGRIRLYCALEKIPPDNVRAFFGLAARQIRWVLKDLARKVRRRGRMQPLPADHLDLNPPDDGDHLSNFDWVLFDREVDALPADLKEIVDLLFIEGVTQEEAAEVIGVCVRTVRRRWVQARLHLEQKLGQRLMEA